MPACRRRCAQPGAVARHGAGVYGPVRRFAPTATEDTHMATFIIVPAEGPTATPIRLNVDTIAYYEETGPDRTSVTFVGDEIQRDLAISISQLDALIGAATTAALRGRRVDFIGG